MSLLREVSGNIVSASRLGTFNLLTVSEQRFTEQRALAQTVQLEGAVPTSNLVNCVFAFPPGIPVLDSSAGTFVDDLLKYTRYSFPLGTPWTIYFIDTAIHQEADGKYYQYQMRRTKFSNQANNFYFLGTEPVADGYWAISGVDLIYSGAAVPGKIGLAGPGQQLFPLVDTVTPPVVQAAAPWFQFYPTAMTPAIDSRRCYYLKYGVPSLTASTEAPAYAGVPYAAQDLYGERGIIKKIIEVYGTTGQSRPADVGFYTYDIGGGEFQFAYVPISEEGNPLSGDWVAAPPRVYRLDTSNTPSIAALEGTYWSVENQGVGVQMFEGNVVDKDTGALLTLQPANPAVYPAGFIVNQTGVASEGAMYPSKYGIVFGPDAATGWQIYYPGALIPGFDSADISNALISL